MRRKLDPPDAAQMEALLDYAVANGTNWKSKLWADWMNARLSGDIHRLRNTHGPSWLANFKLADVPEYQLKLARKRQAMKGYSSYLAECERRYPGGSLSS